MDCASWVQSTDYVPSAVKADVSQGKAVGAHVSELSAAFALALEMGAVLENIAGTIHAHPTLGDFTKQRYAT